MTIPERIEHIASTVQNVGLLGWMLWAALKLFIRPRRLRSSTAAPNPEFTMPPDTATPPQRSPFVVALASLMHSGNFIAAAEVVEKSLLDAGCALAVHALPQAAQGIAAPIAAAAEDEAMAASDSAFRGQPQDSSSMEQRIAGAVSAAVAQAIKEALGK